MNSIIHLGLIAAVATFFLIIYVCRKYRFTSAQGLVFLLLVTALAMPLTWVSVPGLGIHKKVVRLTGDWHQSGEMRLRYGEGKYDFVRLQKTNRAVAWPDHATHELEIIATGERNPASRGMEVWLNEARDGSGTVIPFATFKYDDGWQLKKQSLMSFGNRWSVLQWNGELPSVALNFNSHDWSGKMIVRWDGIEQLVDLYWGVSSQPFVIVLGLQEWQTELPNFLAGQLRIRFDQSGKVTINRLQIGEQILEGNDLLERLYSNQAEIELNNGVVQITPRTPSFEVGIKGNYGSSPGKLGLSLISIFLIWFFILSVGLLFLGQSFISPTLKQNGRIQAGGPQIFTRIDNTALLSIFCLLTIISMYLVYTVPEGDSYANYSEAIDKRNPNPNGLQLWSIGRDGEYHAAYEPGITYLYRFLYKTGNLLDSELKLDANSWTFSLAFVELPHLLVLPITGCLLFVLYRNLKLKLKLAVLLSTLGLLSTIIPIYSTPYTRDGLGIVPILASFYFAFKAYAGDYRRRRLVLLFLSGLFAGITILIKVTAGIFVIPLVIYILLKELGSPRGGWISHFSALVVVGFGIIPMVVVLLADRWTVFGIIGVMPTDMTRTFTESLNNPFYRSIYGLLFSPGAGLFWFNPLLWLVFPSFYYFYKHFRNEAIFFTLHMCGLLLLLAPLNWWDGWVNWGPRYIIMLIPWGLIIIGVWLDSFPSKMKIAVGLIAVGILVQLPMLLMSWDAFQFFDSGAWKEYPWSRVLRNFDPQFSPIIILWKILLARLTYGRWFGNQILYMPDGTTIVDFSIFAHPPWTFWYKIVHLDWAGLWGYVVFSFIGITLSIYGFYWSFREEKHRSIKQLIEEQPQN